MNELTEQKSPLPLPEMALWRRELFERVLRILVIAALFIVLPGLYYLHITHQVWLIPVMLVAYGFIIVVAFAPQIPYGVRAWGFLSVLMALAMTDLFTYGWGEDGRLYLLATVLFATIFLGGRQGLVVLVAACLSLAAFVGLVLAGVVVPPDSVLSSYTNVGLVRGWIIFTVLAVVLFAAFNYIFPRLFDALQHSAILSQTIEEERADLAERMQALQDANLNFQRRAMFLEKTTQVAHTLTMVFDLDALAEQAVNLISDAFDFYHTALFLMSEDEMWAVLKAASSAGGQRMLARGHRLRRGGDSIVGWVAEHRQPRIADYVEQDEVFLASADLSATRSEMALPLMIGDQLIGILDVQSAQTLAFDQDDVRTFQGLVGLLAVAISNARRLGDEASVLEAASPLYRLARHLATTRSEHEIYTIVLDSLRNFNPTRVFIFRFGNVSEPVSLVAEMRRGEVVFYEQQMSTEPIQYISDMVAFSYALKAPLLIGDLTASYQSGQEDMDAVLKCLAEDLGVLALALVPMWVESTLLGTLLVTYNKPHTFTPLQGQLYRVLSDMVAVALERMRLVQQAQLHLERERWIREFGEHVMRIPDLETILSQSALLLQDAAHSDGVLVSLVAPDLEDEDVTRSTQ